MRPLQSFSTINKLTMIFDIKQQAHFFLYLEMSLLSGFIEVK